MNFKKYQHIERFGTDETRGIELGTSYIFPKIDGTNSSVWLDDDMQICAGSRKRELTPENDNAGFYEWVVKQDNIKQYLSEHMNHRLYGEWLVPHSLKTYKDNAWRRFYVFDVMVDHGDFDYYLKYEEYKEFMDQHNIDYIPCIAKITNGSYEQFINQLDKNVFMIKDGNGIGEGIVIKNYDYENCFGRKTWAKIVTSEFKEKHAKVMGATEIQGKKIIEEEIANKYCTSAIIEKVYDKIKVEKGWSSKNIPELLNRVYNDIITEEIWNMVKEYKNPTINFKTLQTFIISKIKEIKNDIF